MSPKDIAASVRQRLMNHARSTGEVFNLVLVRYGLERLLYRLSLSKHQNELILKGGSLFYAWTQQIHRPTRDLDFLGSGSSDLGRMRDIFADIISIDAVDDGLTFDADSLQVEEIKEDQQYEGIRVKMTALLGKATIYLQADIGFGDSTVPEPVEIDYPVLLDFPSPRLRAYAKETVVAEKLQAMVDLGMTNSRMKDFYDLYRFASHFEFDGPLLIDAIASTFRRRKTPVSATPPVAVTSEFVEDDDKQRQWKAFAAKLNSDELLADVTSRISDFVTPCLVAIATTIEFDRVWKDGSWQERSR